jgi:hypothetical protein
MIQVTPQMRIVAAVEPADFRRGIDGLAHSCKEVLKHDPFNGWVFVFRNRSATAIKVLVYDGQGFCFVTNGFPAASSAGGRGARPPQPRRWQPISCTCFSREAIPTPRRRRPHGGRSGKLIFTFFFRSCYGGVCVKRNPPRGTLSAEVARGARSLCWIAVAPSDGSSEARDRRVGHGRAG